MMFESIDNLLSTKIPDPVVLIAFAVIVPVITSVDIVVFDVTEFIVNVAT